MKIFIRNTYNVRPYHQQAVVVMGNFDGVHRGHQKLVQQARAIADQKQRPLLAILFEPQPKEYQCPNTESPPARLFNLREKYLALRALKVDYFLCLRFDHHLQKKTAGEFIRDILLDTLHIKHIVLTKQQCFGYKRTGNLSLLKQYAKQHHFNVSEVDLATEQGRIISSSTIRKLLKTGQLTLAETALGKPYTIIGRVIRGAGLGYVKFGVATANINHKRRHMVLNGVYTVQVQLENGHHYWGVANVGCCPTLTAGRQCRLEVHLFDFCANLYGQLLTIRFIKKLRDEKRFDSPEALHQQILCDLQTARLTFHFPA